MSSRALALALALSALCTSLPAFAASKAKAALIKSDAKSKAKEKEAKAKPKIDTKKLDVLARASTKFSPNQPRVTNIRRIASMMDGVVVQPGQGFSVNHFIGARTEDKGFVAAPSILDLDYTETVGGGISQFATTLYNALYDAGFPIVEHKPHSHFISRYPAGVEATLSWPAPDPVFKNDSESPLVIRATVSKDRVSVKLLGHTPGRKVERKRPVDLERKAAPVEFVPDASVAPTKQKVERDGTPRRSVQVTRVVTNPGGRRRVEEDVVVYLSTKKLVHVNPCKLPKGHKDYTGVRCGKKGAGKSKPKD